jgi:hypothetical protein
MSPWDNETTGSILKGNNLHPGHSYLRENTPSRERHRSKRQKTYKSRKNLQCNDDYSLYN